MKTPSEKPCPTELLIAWVVDLLIQHINEKEILAYDTETESLNTRRGRIIGFSVSGEEGMGFYMPTMFWNNETESLEECQIEGIGCQRIAKKIISMLVGKKLIMHNASFDCRYTNNFYGVMGAKDIWTVPTSRFTKIANDPNDPNQTPQGYMCPHYLFHRKCL